MVVATVIGGAGRMGNWFARFLKANGYTVILTDENRQTARVLSKKYGFQFQSDQFEAASRAQVVVIATPTNVTSTILDQVVPFIKPSTLLVEISSIKGPVQRTVRKLENMGIAVLSIHPMFGPGAKELRGRCILVVRKPRNRQATRILSALRRRGAGIIHCTAKKHDVLVSTILALPHLINISLIETLRSLRVNLNELNSVAGTTFQLQLLLAEAIYNEDYDNEVSILGDSRPAIIEEYYKNVAILIRTRKIQQALVRILKSGRKFVESDPRFACSYGRFNAAVQASLR
jgi:prephenate dehydrogenase